MREGATVTHSKTNALGAKHPLGWRSGEDSSWPGLGLGPGFSPSHHSVAAGGLNLHRIESHSFHQ